MSPAALLLDLDGVVNAGDTALPGAAAAVAAARDAGLAVRFVTNNASRTPAQVAARLTGMGVAAGPAHVVTSSVVAAALLAGRRTAGTGRPEGDGRVAVCGGAGLEAAVAAVGLQPVRVRDVWDGSREPPGALVQGFSPDLAWLDLAAAARLVRHGAWWLATNLDATLPTEHGPAPGNGSLVTAVATAAGRRPDASAGKPAPAMFHAAAAGAGVPAAACLVVGDRLDTDIAGAVAAGMPSLLVLTGVHGVADAVAAAPSERPSDVAPGIGDALVPAPAVEVHGPGRARCGDVAALVERDGGGAGGVRVSLRSPGGDRGVLDLDGLAGAAVPDAVRALVAAAWSFLDTAVDSAVGAGDAVGTRDRAPDDLEALRRAVRTSPVTAALDALARQVAAAGAAHPGRAVDGAAAGVPAGTVAP